MNEMELGLLNELGDYAWRRPLDLGGSSNSRHSYYLNKLVKKGWVERRARSSANNRGSYRYRITEAGKAQLAQAISERT